MILSTKDVVTVLSLISLEQLKNLKMRLDKPGYIFLNDRILVNNCNPGEMEKNSVDMINDLLTNIDNHPIVKNLDSLSDICERRAVGFTALASTFSNSLTAEFENVLFTAGMIYCTIGKNHIHVIGSQSKENFFSILMNKYDDINNKKFWPNKEDLRSFIEYELGDFIY